MLTVFHSISIERSRSNSLRHPKVRCFVFINEFVEKKTLIFDLDETLIRSEFSLKEGYDHKFVINSLVARTGLLLVYLYVRPGVKEMLNDLKKHFELIIFTASQEDYAHQVRLCLDPDEEIFDHMLSREHCLNIEKHKINVKDLSLLLSGREMKDIVIVDNHVLSYVINIDNGIPIKDFYGDKSDTEIITLHKYIKKNLLYVNDVRDVLRRDFLDQRVIEAKK
jgi:CTD small phosphatase-like protein 2